MNRGLKSVAIFVLFALIVTLGRHSLHHTTTTTSTTPTTLGSTTTVASTTTSLPATSTSTSTSTTVAVTVCQGKNFSGVFHLGAAAAGTVGGTIVVTNHGGTCQISGFALLSAFDHSGASVHLSVSDQGGSANSPVRTVAAGATSSVDLRWNDIPQGNEVCPNVRTFNVQFLPRDTAILVTLTYPISPCGHGAITLSPWG